jgi:hypothetical protein
MAAVKPTKQDVFTAFSGTSCVSPVINKPTTIGLTQKGLGQLVKEETTERYLRRLLERAALVLN